MEWLKDEYIDYAAMIIIPINSCITFILKKEPIQSYLIYGLPFLILIIIYSIFKKHRFKMEAIILWICSIFSIIFGTWGNVIGSWFICIGAYTWNNHKAIWIISVLTVISIAIKMTFFDGTIPRVINYIVVYGWIIYKYYKKIHPKQKVFHREIDEINEQIIKLLISGKNPKMIGSILHISPNAVSKRIGRMRELFNCGNNEQMIYYLTDNGYLRRN